MSSITILEKPVSGLNTKHTLAGWLASGGLLLAGIGGAFAPWVWRQAVALQLTAPGLAEFVKFLAEVRTAQIQVQRLHFLLPLFVAMLALPVLVENRALGLPRWWRWLLRLAVIPLALAALSPVWTPAILMAAEFRTQTLLAGLAVGLALVAPLLRGLPLKWLAVALALAGATALALAFRQFALVQPGIENAYHSRVTPGWGWWLTAAGFALSIGGGLWAAFGRK
ncbi:MAG: hypothetical protein D6768_00195 [Chloroflexi bacterium]|nr:MAG: hypothetical protein D6768_00195 [Chloroflexota bacterium]